MSETKPSPSETIAIKNKELLIDEGGVLGPTLATAYDFALREEPLVAEAPIILLPHESSSTSIARYGDKTESGRHEVAIMLGDMKYALSRKEQERRMVGIYDTLMAERLGIDPANITPQLIFVHDFLHELGHVARYSKTDNLEALRAHNRQQRQAMPLGDRRVSWLLDPKREDHGYLVQNGADLMTQLGCSTLGELIDLQFAAYRNLDGEREADHFAARILTQNPGLLASLFPHGDTQRRLDEAQVAFDQRF